MPIICISDLHLADKGPRDNFIPRGESRFRRFLDYVRHQNAKLRILGDLMDWWVCNFSKTIDSYSTLLSIMHSQVETYTWGNHDSLFAGFGHVHEFLPQIPTVMLGRPPRMDMIGSRRFLFCHGHEADPTCSTLNPGIGAITAIISGLLEDRNNGPTKDGRSIEDRFVGSLEAALNLWRTFSHGQDRTVELLEGIESYRQKCMADVVICGHTHNQGRIGDHHYNCGCWCRDRDGFTRIEDDGTVSMWTWNEDHAEPFDEVLL